mmetsp:Transcript_21615/g.50840  ORF Transcript_21615/g.50840 Transcript_21615/m.50840 type:complete len:500 (+) Transcript_21615:32-1531(+)
MNEKRSQGPPEDFCRDDHKPPPPPTMEPMLKRSPYLSALCTDPQAGPTTTGPTAVSRQPPSANVWTVQTTTRGCGTGGNSSDPSSTATGTSTRSNKRKAADADRGGNFADLFELRRPSSSAGNKSVNGIGSNVDTLVSQLRIQSMHSIAEASASSFANGSPGSNSASKRRASSRSGQRSSTSSSSLPSPVAPSSNAAPASTSTTATSMLTRKLQYYHPNPFSSTNNLVARLAEEKELGASISGSTSGTSSTTGYGSSSSVAAQNTSSAASSRRTSAPLVSEYGSESECSASGLDSNPTTPTDTLPARPGSISAKRRTRTLPVMTTSVTANFFPAVLDRGDGEDSGARNEAWKTIRLEYWDDRGRVAEPPEGLGGPPRESARPAPPGAATSSSLPASYPPPPAGVSGLAPPGGTSLLASSFVRRNESTDRFAELVSEFASSNGGFRVGTSPPSSVGAAGRPSGGRRGSASGSGMHRGRAEAGLSFGRIGPEMMSSSLTRR